jgi:large subunit ribosomal protein L9
MSKDIEVLFLQDKKGYFKIGQVKRVKMGYARNYLFPRGFATVVTSATLLKQKSIKKEADKRQAELKLQADALQGLLSNKVVLLKVKANEENKLYGSVTPQDISEALLTQYNVTVDKLDIKLPFSIKELGEFSYQIDLHSQVEIKGIVSVLPEEEKNDSEQEKLKRPGRKRQISRPVQEA